MGRISKGFVCTETKPCYAKENGRCGILDVGGRTILVDGDTPALKELFRVKYSKHISFTGRRYKDGECPFRKDCRNDVVIDHETVKRGEHDCIVCMFSPTCTRGKR